MHYKANVQATLETLVETANSLPTYIRNLAVLLQAQCVDVLCICSSLSLSPPGALIYLLNLFCNSQNPTVREETASLFAKMITDKLVGPRVRIVLSKFLPLIFMDAMRDSPEASVHMFESTSMDRCLLCMVCVCVCVCACLCVLE